MAFSPADDAGAPRWARALWLARAVLAALLPLHAAADAPAALLTIADGPVELLRGAQRQAAAEGLSLAANDLLRTAPGTRVVRIEFADGRVLDLGPGTQALLPTPAVAATAGAPGATAVVIRGWAKLAAPAAVNAGAGASGQLAAPGLVLHTPPAGTTLLHVAPDGAVMVFAESRGATLTRRAGAPGTPAEAVLREGDAWVREVGAATGDRVAAATALRKVPRALADTLPRRAALLVAAEFDAAAGQPLGATDLADWLRTEPLLMAALRPRARASVPAAATAMASGGHRRPPPVAQAARRAAAVAALPEPAIAAPQAVAALDLPATVPAASRPAGVAGLPALASLPAPARVERTDAPVPPPVAPRRR